MPTNRFDALSKTFSARQSRRTALKTTGLGLAAGIEGTQARAQRATPVPGSDDPTFLFVQTATSGSFTPNPGAGTPVSGAFHGMAVACDRRFSECDDACIACTQSFAQQGS